METLQLRVQTREAVGRKKNDALRRLGKIPAVLYGHQAENRNLLTGRTDFLKLYLRSGASTLIDLVVDDRPAVKALIQEVQTDPLTQEPVHVDFHQVNLKEKITAHIKLRFTGVSAAIKEHGGVLITNLDAVEVSCLPQDLVPAITVDIAPLKTFNDYVHIKDLRLPRGITPLAKPDAVVAHVIPPRTEEELQALDQQPLAAVPTEVPQAGKEQPQEHAAADAQAEGGHPAKT